MRTLNMNIKQWVVLLIVIVSIAAIIYFTPKYKFVKIGDSGFIRAEEDNPLYKNIQAAELIDWSRVFLYSLPVLVLGVIFLIIFRDFKIASNDKDKNIQ